MRTASYLTSVMATFVLVCATSSAYAISSRTLIAPTGAAASEGFGISVSSAGDVNGDGFDDVIIGAYQADGGVGQAYVYYGGPIAIPVLTLTSPAPAAVGDRFGWSVASAGDLNGDGFDDVIVGAYLNDAAAGRAHVYFGGPIAIPVLTLDGAAAGDDLGFSVASAGDVNGDGYDDIIVGAHGNNTVASNAGVAYLYYGGPSPDNLADATLLGAAANDHFGISVASAGDMNNDGFADVIVGSEHQDFGGIDAGRAYVYYGGRTVDLNADVILTGAAAGDELGISVASAGDVNGDGFADVIVGARLSDVGGVDAGQAYVYYGGTSPDDVVDFTITGAAAGDRLGHTVASAGDVDGDGYSDVIVGAQLNDAGGTSAGRAYIYFGSSLILAGTNAFTLADLDFTGAFAVDQLGVSVSSAGDMTGDGFDDVIVGAYGSDAAFTDAGNAYVYDFNRYHLVAPNGGELWNVGATKTITWTGQDLADIWLSVDGGANYARLEKGVGGSDLNAIAVRVPHLPTRFARVQITPTSTTLGGRDRSDTLFTIQTSVALLALLAAPAPNRGSGVVISWRTDPGPEDLAGYRLERASSGSDWRTVASLTRETSVTDPDGGPGSRYRLSAVNGLGEELWLGETSLRPAAPLAAWPLPYRGGSLSIAFATSGGLGGGTGRTEVAIFDVSGRLVRTVAREAFSAGYQSAVWDGRDDRGRLAPTGIYFLRAQGASGDERSVKIAVLR